MGCGHGIVDKAVLPTKGWRLSGRSAEEIQASNPAGVIGTTRENLKTAAEGENEI